MNIILEIIQLRKMKAKINITKNGEILKLPIKKLSLAIFYKIKPRKIQHLYDTYEYV